MSLLLALTGGGGSGVNHTLTGDAGSYTLTGRAASFQVSRTLSGAAGAYSLTGRAGSFSVGRALTGASGSYTVTGQAATLTHSTGGTAHTLSGDAGAYVVAGFDGAFAVTVGSRGAGKGKTLADYEAEWALQRAQEAVEQARTAPAQVRRRIKREAAREVYFKPPAEVQAKADQLTARRELAQLAEMRALLDLAATTSAAQAEIAHVAVEMARRKKAEAEAAIEEFDVMYVAAILAGA